jgi:ATP-binding protein involved in chromosome partitioning
MLTRDIILSRLSPVAGAISGLTIKGSDVGFILTCTAENAATLEAECRDALATLAGIGRITIITTNATSPDLPAAAPAPAPAPKAPPPAPRTDNSAPSLPGIRRVIAIAAGKGGVGKSTLTVLLAHALTARGERVAICDCDIHGPSIPRMLGLPLHQPALADGQMVPPIAHGIAAHSIALITGESAAIMRGPMVTKSLRQLLFGTDWTHGTPEAAPTTLLLDLPPGTGDIQLSLVQSLHIDGALLLTTPQDIAVMDAAKAGEMFRKVNVPLLGVVENMSGFTDPSGTTHALFGAGGGQRLADHFGIPLLAQLPLDPAIGRAMDEGRAPQEPLALHAIAKAVAHL